MYNEILEFKNKLERERKLRHQIDTLELEKRFANLASRVTGPNFTPCESLQSNAGSISDEKDHVYQQKNVF